MRILPAPSSFAPWVTG